MWRTLFMAFGAFVFLLGTQCLVVEKFVLKSRAQVIQTNWLGQSRTSLGSHHEVIPKEWAPWSFMSGGAVVWLYAVAISNRMKK